jgi:hypothetical protein
VSDLLEYKGYSGTVEYSAADQVLHGRVLGIRSMLTYEGTSLDSLRRDFEETIDDYIEDTADLRDWETAKAEFDTDPVTFSSEEIMKEFGLR